MQTSSHDPFRTTTFGVFVLSAAILLALLLPPILIAFVSIGIALPLGAAMSRVAEPLTVVPTGRSVRPWTPRGPPVP